MKTKTYTARSSITIDASRKQVWQALTEQDLIKNYFFGEIIIEDLCVGAPIIFRFSGDEDDDVFEREGLITRIEQGKILQYEMFADGDEIKRTVEIELTKIGKKTGVSFSQGSYLTEEDKGYCEESYNMLLNRLKNFVED